MTEAIYVNNVSGNLILVGIDPSPYIRYADKSNPLLFSSLKELEEFLICWEYELIGYL